VANYIGGRTLLRRTALTVTVLAAACGITLYAGAAGAGAAAKPTIAQVKAKISSLQGQVDKIGQEYDAAGQQLSAAKARLAAVTQQTDRAQAQYNQASATLTAVAVAAYENSGQTSILGLLTSGDPTQVLGQASLVLQIEGTHNEQAQQFLTLARELATIQQQRQRTETSVAQLTAQYGSQKKSMSQLLDTQTSLLNSLTAQQQAQVTAAEVGGAASSGTVSTTPVAYTGSTSTEAGQAVKFAYAQLGKPYVYGATGPDSYDCSGLVQAAWAAAGVSIPRTTYEQWAALPHIPMSDLQPGDLIYYNGESHVSMYVGNGNIIDAPHTGATVEMLPEDTSWYAQLADGAVRP
jgi:cell wall-associated NlpC family hydrolase